MSALVWLFIKRIAITVGCFWWWWCLKGCLEELYWKCSKNQNFWIQFVAFILISLRVCSQMGNSDKNAFKLYTKTRNLICLRIRFDWDNEYCGRKGPLNCYIQCHILIIMYSPLTSLLMFISDWGRKEMVCRGVATGIPYLPGITNLITDKELLAFLITWS